MSDNVETPTNGHAFVYLMQWEAGLYKIGYSANPESRRSTDALGCTFNDFVLDTPLSMPDKHAEVAHT